MTRVFFDPLLGHPEFADVVSQALARTGLVEVPFLSASWIHSYARAVESVRNGEVLVATVADSTGVTCLPVVKDGSSAALAPIRWSDYVDAYSTCESSRDAAVHLRAILGEVGGFRTRELHPHGLLAKLLPDLAHYVGVVNIEYSRHYVRTLTLGVDQEVGRLIGSETWKKKQRRARRMGYRCVRRSSGEISAEHLEGFAEMHRQRWLWAGYPSIFDDEHFRRLFAEVVVNCETLVMYVLEDAEGEAHAYRVGMSTPSTYYDWLTAFDVHRRSESPGLLLLAAVMETERSHGTRVINFLRGSEKYKAELSDGSLLVPRWERTPW